MSKETNDTKIQEFADAITASLEPSENPSNIVFGGTPYLDHLEKFGDGVTEEMISKVNDYDKDFTLAGTRAFVNAAHNAAKENPDVKEFHTVFDKTDKNSLSMGLSAEKTYPIPNSTEKVTKFGRVQITSTHSAEKGTSGPLKKEFERSSEMFEKLLKRD